MHENRDKELANHTLHFNFSNKFVLLKEKIFRLCKRKVKFTEDERYFVKGEKMVLNELNIFNII